MTQSSLDHKTRFIRTTALYGHCVCLSVCVIVRDRRWFMDGSGFMDLSGTDNFAKPFNV